MSIAMRHRRPTNPVGHNPKAHCKVKPTNHLQCTLSYRLTSGLKDDLRIFLRSPAA